MNITPADPDTLTVQQYRDAFHKSRVRLTDKQLAMLRVHYHAPSRKITARQMAEAVGYPNHATVNLQYGKVGALLCEILGQSLGSDCLHILAHFVPPRTEGNDEWLWQMREPAAQVLQELGWT